jgi:hypothetical protein
MSVGERWIKGKWRPLMGWMYMVVCVFDFIIFPAVWSLLLFKAGQPITQWKPLTLESAGFFHMAMGAVLGIYVWKRTEEKLKENIGEK